jgi:N-acetylglucosaminyl-diphospho-decaprenol L-rhamnosyltransferase
VAAARSSSRTAGEAAVDVVIVSYRSRSLVRSCLESLRDHSPAGGAAVFVVDNASRDGTVEMIRSEFPEVTMIPSERNIGFGAANNVAIRQGSGRYVLALNPDTRVTRGALDALIRLMDERPEVGMCGCRLVREDGSFDHAAKRSFPTIAGALGHFVGIGRKSGAPRWLAQYRAPEVDAGPVDAVNGAFMLMRRAALDEVGTFDEGFWMYMEDLDLCYRLHTAGWVTWYEPSVTVWHAKHGTSGAIRSPRLNYAFHYGMFRFYRKHYARRNSHVTNLIVYAGIGAKLAISLVRSELRRAITRVTASR